MKTVVLYFFVLIVPDLLFSQVTFEKTFTVNGNDKGISVLETKDGNYLIYCISEGPVKNNCSLIKTGANGDSLWGKRYPGFNTSWIISNHEPIKETEDSGYIFTTVIVDTTLLIKTNNNGDTLWKLKYIHLKYATFQPTTDGGFILCGIDSTGKLSLIKTNNLGHQLWRKWISLFDRYYTYINRDFSVKQTTDEGFIVSGNLYNDIAFITLPVYTFLIRANSTGDSLWAKKIDTLPFQSISNVQATSGNGFIVAGSLDSLTNFNPEHLNGFIMRFDENGNSLWTKSYGGTGNQEFNSLKMTDDGGYIACGDNNPDLTTPPPFGFYGFYLVRMNAAGDTLWTKCYPGGQSGWSDIVGLSVQETSDHGFIACGTQWDSTGNGHVFLIKTDSLGNVYPQGINDNHPFSSLLPFPNPTRGMVFLNPPGNFRELEVLDILGNVILHMKIDPNDNSTLKINLSGNPEGIYLLKLKNENSIRFGKIVLSH
jgi:hypothetical protein